MTSQIATTLKNGNSTHIITSHRENPSKIRESKKSGFLFLAADVMNDDDGKKSFGIEDGENVVNEIHFAKERKRKMNRNDIAKVREIYKKSKKLNNVPAVWKHDPRADNARKSNDARTVIQGEGWPKLYDVRTFTEDRSGHTGWPVVCVKKAVPTCSDVKFRGRKVTYCLYKLQNVCNQWN